MGKIICATRGGEVSYRTQDAAIKLAKERNHQLVFLFIVDLGFLDKTARAVRPEVVKKEMTLLGEFLLSMAQERARAQGIQAQPLIRYGNLRQQLIAAVQKEAADILVLGRPAGKDSAFPLAALERLANEIENLTGARVVVV